MKHLERAEDAVPHHDPFDRLLIAQAVQEGMTLITHDNLLPGYDVNCILHF
ncbi:MAG: hypothetical protein VZQ80_05180 [Lachnospiraceae bacterium]|nr:hypothetical protein [Lachnospiraceae bacterium]